MDGEVRIRNYFNDFQHNHHNCSHGMRERICQEIDEDFESKQNFQMWHSRQVAAEDLQFPVKVCGSYSNKVEWFNSYFDLYSNKVKWFRNDLNQIFKQSWLIEKMI